MILNRKKVARRYLIMLMTTFLCVGLFTLHPNAESMTWDYMYYHTSNNIRATCSGYREVDANYYIYDNPSNLKYREVIYVNFAGPVTGSFTLGLTQMVRGDIVLTENCVISSNVSSTSITFSVSGVDSCRIEVYSSSAARGLTSFTGNWSADADLDDINTTLNTIKGYVDGVETSLHNIYTALTILNSYTNDLEPLLDTNNSILSRILARNGLLLDSIYFSWNTSNESLGSGNVSNTNDPNLYIYQTGLSNLTVKRVDARFSTNDVKDGNYMVLKWFFGMSDSGSAAQYYDFPTLRFQYRDINGNMNNIGVFTGDSLNWTKFVEYNTTRNTYIVSVYVPISCFMASNNATFTYDFAIDFFELNNITTLGFMFGGMVDSLPYDEKYVSLLQQISDSIGNISQQQITENNTNISHYNSYMTDIHNVENNYYTQYNTYDQLIDQNNTFDFTGLPSGNVVYTNLFTQLWSFDFVKWPILIILLGTVLIIIMG